jgi:hypothetical protein
LTFEPSRRADRVVGSGIGLDEVDVDEDDLAVKPLYGLGKFVVINNVLARSYRASYTSP